MEHKLGGGRGTLHIHHHSIETFAPNSLVAETVPGERQEST